MKLQIKTATRTFFVDVPSEVYIHEYLKDWFRTHIHNLYSLAQNEPILIAEYIEPTKIEHDLQENI